MDAQNITAMILVTALFIFVAWRWFALREARETRRHEEDYKRLTTAATQAQEEAVGQLREINTTVAELRERITAIEKLLREVP